MDVQLAESGPCRRSLTITVPPERIRSELEQMYQAASSQVQLKGFRSGKVPRKVIEKKFGDAIRSDAKERIVSEVFNDAIRQHELKIVGKPKIEGITEEPINPDQALEFTVEVDIAPEFELGDVEGIEVTAQTTDVTDEDIQGALDQLAGQKRTLETVDEPVEENDFIKADIRYLDAEGNVVLERMDSQLSPNIPVAGSDPEVFKTALIGREKGATFEVEVTYPDAFEKEEVRGQTGKVSATLNEIQRVTPAPIDDALAKDFDFDSLDAMRDELSKRIGEEKVNGEKRRQEEQILQILASTHPFALPESMVEDQLEHSLQTFAQRLKQSGASDEEIPQRIEEAREEARTDSENRVRLFFLLNEIARQKEIRVEQADIQAEMQMIAMQNGVGIEQVQEHFQKQGNLGDMQLAIIERKVREFLRDKAKISDS